eukprot:5592545-Alexandrium_andersonii.AAC.1
MDCPLTHSPPLHHQQLRQDSEGRIPGLPSWQPGMRLPSPPHWSGPSRQPSQHGRPSCGPSSEAQT